MSLDLTVQAIKRSINYHNHGADGVELNILQALS